MLDSLNYHTFLEGIGAVTLAVAVLVPFYGAVWEISKARYLRQLAEKEGDR